MSERVILFDRSGIPQMELNAPVVRNWKLEHSVSAERAIFELDPADVPAGMLDYGNFIGVFSDDLPIWAGVIWPDRTWPGGGKVLVEAKGAEYILNFRVSGMNDRITGSPGLIFSKLLNSIQASWRPRLPLLIIDESNFIHAGYPRTKTYYYERLFDAANDLAEESHQYWWLEPELDPRGRLRLVAHWQVKRGRKPGVRLIEGSNFSPDEVREMGDIANKLIAIGVHQGWKNPLKVVEYDNESISDYGLIEDVLMDESCGSASVLSRKALSRLKKTAQPRIVITGSVYETPFPQVGDLVDVQLTYELYTAKGVNLGRLLTNLELMEISYSSVEKTAEVTLDSAGINDEGE